MRSGAVRHAWPHDSTGRPPRSPRCAVLGCLLVTGCGVRAGEVRPVGGRRPGDPHARPPTRTTSSTRSTTRGCRWRPGTSGSTSPWAPSRRRSTVTVTDETQVVQGVTTTVVHDVVTDADGEVVEDTFDWFAQDPAGNVWYFGEDTTEYDEQGRPDTDGSWEAGVDGAQAGIVMLAKPRVGDGYQQEFSEGVAEDRATVLSLDESVNVPFGSFADVLQTEETNRSSRALSSTSTTPAGSAWSSRRPSPAASSASSWSTSPRLTLTRQESDGSACARRDPRAGQRWSWPAGRIWVGPGLSGRCGRRPCCRGRGAGGGGPSRAAGSPAGSARLAARLRSAGACWPGCDPLLAAAAGVALVPLLLVLVRGAVAGHGRRRAARPNAQPGARHRRARRGRTGAGRSGRRARRRGAAPG